MRKALLVLFLILFLHSRANLAGQERALPAPYLPEFLARHEHSLLLVDEIYAELAKERLPLRDDAGHSATRRPIEDRHQALEEVRNTVQQLRENPEDLVLATRLFFRTEILVDNLFDLSQVAQENDRDEVARQLAQLTRVLEHHTRLIESYTLGLAAEKQARLRELEKENQALRQKLSEATQQPAAQASRP